MLFLSMVDILMILLEVPYNKQSYRKMIIVGAFEYYFENECFDSVNKLSKKLKLSRQYINDTFNDSNSKHNLYNLTKMKTVIDYCNSNQIEI